jgi:hypothetical protein
MASVPTPWNSLLGLLDASRNGTAPEQGAAAVSTGRRMPKLLQGAAEVIVKMGRLLRAVQNGGAGEVSRRFNLAAHMSAVL